MKVLMFEPSGGFWPHIPELSEALALAGVELFFLSSRSRQAERVDHVIFLPMAKPFDATLVRRFSPNWIWDRLITGYQWLAIRKKMLAEIQPDIVHIQSTASLLDQFFIDGVKKTAKVVLTVHDVLPITHSIANRSRRGMTKLYQSADQLIVHSQRNKQELMEHFSLDERRISVIPMGLAPGIPMEKNLARERIGIRQDENYILLFGVLRRTKGVDLAIQAVRRLSEDMPHRRVKLLLAGPAHSQPEMEEIAVLINNSGITDTIVMHNRYIPEESVAAYFCAADLVLLPYTKFYSQSGVLFQAYKYGTPVVVTNIGSLGETVQHDGSGLVAGEATPAALAAAMANLLTDEELYRRCTAHQQAAAREKYAWAHIARQTKALYEAVLSRRP